MEPLYGTGTVPDDVSGAASAPDADAGVRRFGGVARLYGAQACARFARARVAVVGVGGVGTWVAEALARSGLGSLTLIDLDHVSESNTNRQIHALDGNFGMAKVRAMAQRVRAIHPGARVVEREEFLGPENVAALLADLDAVVDCTDSVVAKAAVIAYAHAHALPVITCGAAGGRMDPGRIQVDDLARTRGDALLANVRSRLRRAHGFPAAGTGKRPARFGVEAVFSDECPAPLAPRCASEGAPPGSPLACGGYGSAVTVTGSMGFAAAARALALLQAP